MEFKYSTKYLHIQESKSIYPTVSICSIDGFSNSDGREFLRHYYNSSPFLTAEYPGNGDMTDEFIAITYNGITYNKILIDSNDTYQSQLTNFINETVLLCMFQLRKCLDEELTWYHHKIFGRCLRFETKTKTYNSGSLEGLRIELLLEPEMLDLNLENSRGAHVLITNDSLQASIILSDIKASTNKDTLIAIDRMYTEQLDYPYNDCIKDDSYNDIPIYQTITSRNYTYSQQ